MAAAAHDPLIGRVLDGRYRIDQQIGRGGMGDVYRGRHLLMERSVALKLLRPDRAADPTAVRRFVREAKSAFRLDHPGCVRVTDFGAAEDGLLYLVMELLDGRTVGEELAVDGPLAPARVVHVARQVCDALDCAHRLGLIHRDLKPDNIMLLSRDGDPDFVKVLDFGLAKLFDAGAAVTAMSISPLTRQGVVFGTPEYMSPEQATDQPLTPATDLYSLGVVLYEMLTGLLPFQGASFMAVLRMHVQQAPVPPAERRPELGIPPAVDALVMRCLAKQPADRPADARTLAGELAALSAIPDGSAPPRVSRTLAAADTVDLSQSAMELLAAAESGPATPGARVAASPPSPAAPNRDPGRDARRTGRGAALALAAVVSVAAAVAVIAALTRAPGDPTAAAGPPAAVASIDGGVVGDARPLGDAPLGDAPPADAPLADAPPAAAAPPRRERGEPASTDPHRGRVDAHLAAAEEAQRAGNTLRQMAEADTALRLDRGSRRAAYLLGDALVRSGDTANGCRYLARARGLAASRARARDAGCTTAPSD